MKRQGEPRLPLFYSLLEGLCVKDFIWSAVSESFDKDLCCAVFGFLSRCRWYDVCSLPELILDNIIVGDSPKRESCIIRLRFIGCLCHRCFSLCARDAQVNNISFHGVCNPPCRPSCDLRRRSRRARRAVPCPDQYLMLSGLGETIGAVWSLSHLWSR